MTVFHAEIPPHWNYFLYLEDDVERLSRWIEFSKANEDVYSIELVRLLMTASAEVDVIAKLLCKAISQQSRADSIGTYKRELIEAFPMLPSATVTMPRFSMTFQPWVEWITSDEAPCWWSANNMIKHRRADHYQDACLKHMLNAVAALLVLLLIYYRSKGHTLYPLPRLFRPKTFATYQGDELLLLLPDGTKVPWG